MSHTVLDDFREHLISVSLSEKTIKAYTGYLRRALDWAETMGVDLVAPAPSEVATLAETFSFTAASRRPLRATLRHFWAMHGVEGPTGAVRVPKRPRAVWRGLDDEKVGLLLATAEGDWPRGGVIYLGVYLGLRREEMTRLRWSHFEGDLDWVNIMGKGDRPRRLPVHPRLKAKLASARWPAGFVFPGRHVGRPITTTTVSNWVAEMGVEAGIGHVHPHQLRHTCGGKIYAETGDVYLAKEWLGHADVTSTLIYTFVADDQLQRAMGAIHWGDATSTNVEVDRVPAVEATGEALDESETIWLEDQYRRGHNPGDEAVERLYRKYRMQGHLVTNGHIGPPDPNRRIFRAWCSCGERTGTINYAEMRRWTRAHRADVGLDLQDWTPNEALDETG